MNINLKNNQINIKTLNLDLSHFTMSILTSTLLDLKKKKLT